MNVILDALIYLIVGYVFALVYDAVSPGTIVEENFIPIIDKADLMIFIAFWPVVIIVIFGSIFKSVWGRF